MSELQKEALSALFDGETTEFETRRLLSQLDEESRLKWQRYQFIRDAAANKLQASNFTFNIADKVAAQIAGEQVVTPVVTTKPKQSPWLKPLTGFAVAASISFVTVFALQNMRQDANMPAAGFVANGNVSASQLQISGGLGLNQVSGSATVLLDNELRNIDAQKLRDQERLQYYLQQHSENASFNNGRGLLPMARMTREEE